MKKSFLNKKILFVIPYFVPAWSYGGPVKASFDFARELIKLGHQVSVLTTDVLDAKERNKKLHEKIEGINVVRFKNINNGFAKKFNFYLPVGFKKWLKNNIQNYDIIHIHEYFTYQSIITSRICHKFNKPYMLQPHGSLFQVARESRFYFIKNFIIKKFASLALSSKAIIVLNDQEGRDIANIYPQMKSKIKIVPNGLNLDEFKNIKTINLYKCYNIPKGNKVIAFIGRIKHVKGLDISLKALSMIKDQCNFTFLIIGPDEGEKSNLLKLSKEFGMQNQIVFTGLMSGNKKFETLKSADLSLLLSRSEGLPTTLLESAALGLPIICSRQSNLPEVEKYKAGFVVDSEEQAAQMIKLVLDDAQLRQKLSENALKLADSFNIKKCTQTLNNIYQSII